MEKRHFINNLILFLALSMSLALGVNYSVLGEEKSFYEYDSEEDSRENSEEDSEDEFYGYRALPEENIPIGRLDYSYDNGELGRVFGNIPEAYPYDANEYVTKLPEYIPDVRNQNPTGSCWAHTSLAMAEINLAKKGTISNNSANYSEVDLCYFSYNFVEDPLGGTKGDSNIAKYIDQPNCYMVGGNMRFSEHTLAGWIGASDEIKHGTSIASLPSNINTLSEDNPNGIITDSMAYDDEAHLIGSYHADITNYMLKNGTISDADKNAMLDEVKALIMKNGAVGISYASSSSFYNRTKSSYYYPNSTDKTNHAVTIIGWDDNYSKSNFTYTPKGDGAWLVRNSWGPSWEYGKNGYFWLSYYDKSIYTEAISFEFDKSDNYDRNYQHDGCMNSTTMGNMPKGSMVANVFTAAECEYGKIEKLKAVSYYSAVPTQKIRVDVYKNLADKADPLSGICVSSKEEILYYAGFHTIKLNDEVLLRNKTAFSVVITLMNDQIFNESTGKSENNNKFVCEKSVDASWYKCVASKDSNTSFYRMNENSKWNTPWSGNSALGNIRIKAFTDLEIPEKPETYSIDYVLNDGENHILNPHEYVKGTESVLIKVPTKQDNLFAGWFYDADFTRPLDINSSGDYILTLSNKDIVIYAKWVSRSYELIYKSYDAETDPKVVKVLLDQDVIILDNMYPKKGYTFICWNTSEDGSGTSYIANQNAGKNLCNPDEGELSLTLYPVFEANTYTVTYHPNGGKGETYSENFTYDEEGIISKNRFTYVFKSFSYFCTTQTGRDGVIFTEGYPFMNLCTGDENDNNIDLYAIWNDIDEEYFFEGLLEEYPYTGDFIIPDFDVWMIDNNGKEVKLINGVDYVIKVKNNKLPLSVATISITGKNNYSGNLSAVKTFRISDDPAKKASTGYISLSKNYKISVLNTGGVFYNGDKIEPEIIFDTKPGCEGLALPTLHKDYEIVYSNNINAGKATAYVYAVGERYCDSIRINFNIKKLNLAQNSSKFTVSISENAVLNNKKGAVPKMEVTYDVDGYSQSLVEGKDYTVKFLNNKKVTKNATFIITGKGNYSGKLDSKIGGFYGDRTFCVDKGSIESEDDFIICSPDINNNDRIMSTKFETYDIYGNKLKTKLVFNENEVVGKTVDVAIKISCNGIVLNPQSKSDKLLFAKSQDDIYAEFIGVNNYSGKVIKKIGVSDKDAYVSKIAKVRFTGTEKHYYDGTQKTLSNGEIEVLSKGGYEVSNKFYDILYMRNIDKGNAIAFVVGKNGATGYKKIKYKIYAGKLPDAK